MLSIRRANLNDAENIARVHVQSWRESYRGIVPGDFLKNLSLERRILQWQNSLSNVQSEYHRAFVAETGGEIAGFANHGRERESDPAYAGELYAIYILQSTHRKGVGRALVGAAARDLLGCKLTSMLVWVLADNPARGFYERLGGRYLRQKPIEIGGIDLFEAAYGWDDIRVLIDARGG